MLCRFVCCVVFYSITEIKSFINKPISGKMEKKRIYFDYNATTPVDPRVSRQMDEVARDCFGNPSSTHGFGRQAAEVLARARARVAESLGAESDEICFTSGGSESDNLALKGVLLPRLREKGARPHLVISAVEHPAVSEAAGWLEKMGVEVTRLPVAADGTLDPAAVEAALCERTVLVSLMLANNETGVLFPLEEVAAITRKKGVLLHTDAVQAFGKIEIDLKTLGVDLFSVSGHKVYAPKGVGALWIRKEIKLDPLLHGGSQEAGLRAGTENLPGIAAFGEACAILARDGGEERDRIAGLRDRLEEKLDLALGGRLVFHGHRRMRVPNTISLSVPWVDSEALLSYLDLEGIAISAGSACASSEHKSSTVLEAMGVDPSLTRGAIRISLGRWNTADEVEYFVEKFTAVVRRLWSISPLYQSRNQD